jgi:hypothetical protein
MTITSIHIQISSTLAEYTQYLERNDRFLVCDTLNIIYKVKKKGSYRFIGKHLFISISELLTFEWEVIHLQTGSHSPTISVTETADICLQHSELFSLMVGQTTTTTTSLSRFSSWRNVILIEIYFASEGCTPKLQSQWLNCPLLFHMTVATGFTGINCRRRNILLDYAGLNGHWLQTDVGQKTPIIVSEHNDYRSSSVCKSNCCQIFKRKSACGGTSVTTCNE